MKHRFWEKMNSVLTKVFCRRSEKFFQSIASVYRLSPLDNGVCKVFSVVQNHERNYRSKPTHGIGRYKYLLPKEVPKKKKEKLQMKEIKAGTDVEYAVLNVCVSGHDMTLVEHFSQYIHNLCNRLKIKVDESYALPTKFTEVMLMQEHGTKMYTDAILNTHMRVVQLGALSSTLAPIFIEILQRNQPEGVQFSIKEHTEADFYSRFKARPELEELLAQVS
ncbi:39S ribosomal protein L48, mitochondrial isoform X2 [Erpetoichthys calabaricus]|uniref:Large ribosomal subunit protein mL48 n=1 Tax=Erpetoichthys calabaricus TaxID=27687 RepID=A0A8C4RH66_ERPCA|nr:39S ribosomal protein L48, mitochondrial isoform X2 [Erpetoichthys calabaricus]